MKREHSRNIEILTAWIEQLQLQTGAAVPGPAPAHRTQAQGSGPAPDMALYVGDEEEALIDAHASGLINDDQLSEGLQQLGFLNKEVIHS